MQIIDVEQGTPEWLELRKGKITGSKLKDLVSRRKTPNGAKKIGFYQVMSEKIAIPEPNFEMWMVDETPMERGNRLEPEAIELFEKTTKKKVDRVGFCLSDKNPDVALSPDGFIMFRGDYRQAIEVKCLSSAKHLQAYFEQEIPKDYTEQILQYFIVNEKLTTLFFTFYDNRLPDLTLFTIPVHRKDLEEDIRNYLSIQLTELAEIDRLLKTLNNKIK